MKEKKYLLNCKKCKKDTPHIIYYQSKRRGVKLKCLKCEFKRERYINANFLKEVKDGKK